MQHRPGHGTSRGIQQRFRLHHRRDGQRFWSHPTGSDRLYRLAGYTVDRGACALRSRRNCHRQGVDCGIDRRRRCWAVCCFKNLVSGGRADLGQGLERCRCDCRRRLPELAARLVGHCAADCMNHIRRVAISKAEGSAGSSPNPCQARGRKCKQLAAQVQRCFARRRAWVFEQHVAQYRRRLIGQGHKPFARSITPAERGKSLAGSIGIPKPLPVFLLKGSAVRVGHVLIEFRSHDLPRLLIALRLFVGRHAREIDGARSGLQGDKWHGGP